MHNSLKISITFLFLTFNYSSKAQSNYEKLVAGFLQPPAAAKPRVWWHWMNGNISKEGIAKDLGWMKRVGIGGFMNFDAALSTPKIVEKRLSYMTPEWKDAFQFTTKLADSLQLEMAIAGSPGWSESGGPWVPAAFGMKKIVWSETRIKGGEPFSGSLNKPPTTTGVFQNMPIIAEEGLSAPTAPPPEFYKDILVMAYKIPVADISLKKLNPVITSSAGNFTLDQLTDGDLSTGNMLPADTVNGYAWIKFAFPNAQTIKAITIVGGGDKGPFGLYGEMADTRSIEASDDGHIFTKIAFIPASNLLQQTISIPVTTAKYFRITFKNPPPVFSLAAMLASNGEAPKPPAGTAIAEIVLHTATKINWFETKAAFATGNDLYAKPTPETDDAIELNSVINLTDKVNAAGILNWTPPAGEWKVVRFGFSLTGKQNHPASQEATGLEVDKLNPIAVKAYFENYLDQYKAATGGLMGKKGGLKFMVTDSWEAGVQNWTDNLLSEFAKRRGYRMELWMPVLTGQVIKSSKSSEQFLWDFRKTLAELVAENHYDLLTKILDQRGMKRYSESHESGRALIADGMDVKRSAAIPMSAMWTPGAIGGDGTGYKADIRESASVAHIYGQNLVAAESLTALGVMGNAFSYSPEKLKPTADIELASGLNRFVIHTSVHQPKDDKFPGLGLGPFGQWFTRHETWAEQAGAWTTYLARSAYMLQQGKFIADVIYYYGEDNNITSLFGKKLPDVPEGYNYDFVNPDALLNLISVKNNQIITPSGMHYKLLALDSNSSQMTLKVLQKISSLVKAGAVVTGPKPLSSPSLGDDKEIFNTLVKELWGDGIGVKNVGLGKVFNNQTISQSLKSLNIDADFDYIKPQDSAQLLFVHRQSLGQEIYWINNRSNKEENIETSFRTVGKTVEIWQPETGTVTPTSYSFDNGRTKVTLHLQPNDAIFVVFNKNTSLSKYIITTKKETSLKVLDGAWKLSFQKDRGAPADIMIDTLTSWTDNANKGIKYFSGTATYSKMVVMENSLFKKSDQLWLELGDVKNVAEVIINGKSAGTIWKKPFRVNATSALKQGNNKIEIKVTNLWVNRLIGDEQPGVEKKITYTTMPFYNAKSPLLSSGLLGPVSILSIN